MPVAVICCKMIENEIKRAYEQNGLSCPVYWLDAGLHNDPDKLRRTLQDTLDNLPPDITRVILAYGLCGKAVIGLKARNFELVMPKYDDCIAFMLGSNEEKIKNKATYFVTENWLCDEKSMFSEYKYVLDKYGPQKSERIFKRQFVNYNTLGVLDTGCYDVDRLIKRADDIMRLLSLSPKVIKTDCNKLRYLLSPDFSPNDEFLVIPKNGEITEKMFFEFLN